MLLPSDILLLLATNEEVYEPVEGYRLIFTSTSDKAIAL